MSVLITLTGSADAVKAVKALAAPLGLTVVTGKAAKAAEAVTANRPAMIGTPTIKDYTGNAVYFSDEQIEAGEGYTCRAPEPCDRLLKGPSRVAAHGKGKGQHQSK